MIQIALLVALLGVVAYAERASIASLLARFRPTPGGRPQASIEDAVAAVQTLRRFADDADLPDLDRHAVAAGQSLWGPCQHEREGDR